VKPFSARELLVRVGALLQSSQARKQLLEDRQRESDALARLNDLGSRLWRMNDLSAGLNEMLSATIELLGAQMGNIQIVDPSRQVLRIAAQRGFRTDFLEFFAEVSTEDDSACGRALRSGGRIMIEDVEVDGPYAPLRAIARAAGYRAVQSTPLIGRDGAPLGMLSTHWARPHRLSDSDLRRLDLHVRQATDFIERCRTDERLREADRRKDEFIATLSHELRNPLAPLRNALELLRLNGGGDGTTALVREMMERQMDQLVRLVDDLLEMSRISRGAFELRRERVEVRAFVGNALETSDPIIRASRHELRISLPPEPLWVSGDPVRLSQILINLLNNAARYTDAGGRIEVRVQRDGGVVEISVRDSGEGIAPDVLPRLFEMFSRGDRSSGRGQGGLGIGLAISRRLAEMHGGSIEARSEGRGKGAEFIVRLPVAADQSVGSAGRRPAEDGVALQKRILVVDDNRDAADSLAMLLRTLGAEVQVAYDGLEGLKAFQAHEPAVVLLDIGMPGMDGYEVVRRLRDRSSGKHVPIVALSGWGQEDDRRRAREAGFDHHLVKPANIDALQGLLRSLSADRYSA
jgi:signal transduction histidine kinase/ActR/RegA family two-component response regulator